MSIERKLALLEKLLLSKDLRNDLWLLCFTGWFSPLLASKIKAQDLHLIMKWIYEGTEISYNVLNRLYCVIEDEMDKAEIEYSLKYRNR